MAARHPGLCSLKEKLLPVGARTASVRLKRQCASRGQGDFPFRKRADEHMFGVEFQTAAAGGPCPPVLLQVALISHVELCFQQKHQYQSVIILETTAIGRL